MPPIIGIKILFAALWRNIHEVLQHFSILTLGYVFAALKSGYSAILTPSVEAIIGAGLSGLFLALALSRGDLSTDVKVFIQLGTSRCHIRLQNWASALVELSPVDSEDICECLVGDDRKKLCRLLSDHLLSLVELIRSGSGHVTVKGELRRLDPQNLCVFTDRALEIGGSDLPDKEIWTKNIRASQLLVETEGVQTALDRAIKHRRLIERIDFDVISNLFMWYGGAGIICFLWWMVRVYKSR